MGKRPFSLLFGMLLLLFFLAGGEALSQKSPGVITLQPAHVSIGLFYGGCKVRLKAEIPADRDVVIRVVGAGEPLEFKRKGKKFGVIWMSDGEIRYEDVPSVYILRSSQKLGRLASPETLEELKLGSEALQAEVVGDSGSGARALFQDLVKLKEKDGLFSIKEDSVERHPRGEGKQEISCDFLLPAKTPVGEYRVDLFEFEKGRGVLSATGKVKIERSPVISFIISMASNHGLFYGCLAVFIALIAGLVTGLAFGLGRGSAH
jgi:uncharacterized protein (TIGR02186 family)